jgi:hypothetical protein
MQVHRKSESCSCSFPHCGIQPAGAHGSSFIGGPKPRVHAGTRNPVSKALQILAFWHLDLGYFGRGLLGSWPQADAGVVLWSLSVCANDWQTSEQLTRLHQPGASDVFGGVGQDAVRDGVANPATAIVVWVAGVPQRKNPGQPVHGAVLLSQGRDVRPAAHFRYND